MIDFTRHVDPYRRIGYVSRDGGYIVWRTGTGGNVEVLHLKADPPMRGTGTSLLREMLLTLESDPPYATVFGFTRVGNMAGRAFYKSSGFTLVEVPGVYAEGRAVLFTAVYGELFETHLKRKPG